MADPLRPLPLQGSLVPDEGVVPPVPDIVPPVPEYLQPGIAQAPLSPGLIGDMGATPELMPLQGALPSAPQPALMGALPEVTTPAPTFTPTLEPVAAQPTPAPTPTPTPAAAPNRYAGIQRRAVEQASAEAQAARTAAVGYTAFAERLEEINQRDDRARQEAQANLAKLGKQMEADRDEIRELSRVAAAGPSKGAKAGFLIGGALQAIKTMIGAGPANLELMDEVLARDAEQKATAVVEAQRRAGVTGQARDDEMGRQQSLDYFKARWPSRTRGASSKPTFRPKLRRRPTWQLAIDWRPLRLMLASVRSAPKPRPHKRRMGASLAIASSSPTSRAIASSSPTSR
jgi:hypothetical protein